MTFLSLRNQDKDGSEIYTIDNIKELLEIDNEFIEVIGFYCIGDSTFIAEKVLKNPNLPINAFVTREYVIPLGVITRSDWRLAGMTVTDLQDSMVKDGV